MKPILFLLLTLNLSSEPPGRFSERAFKLWMQTDPARIAEFQAFHDFLLDNQVADVVPYYELWRTSTSSAQCRSDAFDVPDRQYWPHIVGTLRFIRDEVEPVIGQVEAVSGYRNETLNRCSGGASKSAHRTYYALDLVPVDKTVTRETLIRKLCAVHATKGQAYAIGLGFYSATRFHIDSMRYRRWGPDGTGKTSPCNAPA